MNGGTAMTQTLRAAVLTISDSVYQGKRRDGSGPAVAELLQQSGWTVVHSRVIADDLAVIAATLRELCSQNVEAVITTGGTGVHPRDVTPEATRKVMAREIPGLAEQMRRDGAKTTPTAALSRGTVGVSGRSLIVNLPGSPQGAVESLKSILPVLPHAVELIAGGNPHTD
jgi:molybdenum cofactor synthesis domain-containing protein